MKTLNYSNKKFVFTLIDAPNTVGVVSYISTDENDRPISVVLSDDRVLNWPNIVMMEPFEGANPYVNQNAATESK